MENLIVVDLFSGAGGFSKGFLLEGFKVCVGVENFKPIAKTFIENFPDAIGDLPSPFEEHNIPDHKVFSIPKSKLKEISRLKRDEALIHFKGADGKNIYELG